MLVDRDGYSDEQTGYVLGIPAGTVASRLHRGRRALRADAWVWLDGSEPQPLDGRARLGIDVERDGAITARSFTVVVP